MADSDKQILITPNISQTAQPEIKFVGKDNSPLYLKVLDDNSLSFEGVQGQVFSISPTMSSGDIFSVSDISGVQSMAINADGTVKIVSSAITTGIASTENYIYLSPSTTNSFLKTSSNGQQITLAADDDLFLHADDAIIFQSEGTTKMSLHNGKLNIGTATTIDYPLEIESSDGLAIDTDNSGAREKRIYATTGNDGSPWDEMVFFSKGSTGGWSGQHTFLVSKSAGTEYEALRIRDDGGGSTSHVLVSHKLGIATTSPEGTLDVRQDNANNAFGLVVGADVSAASLTNDVRKFTRIGMHHYHNAEEHVNLIIGDSDGTDNKVSLGGGTNQGNAATLLNFYAAANDATVTGTIQANITSSGLQLGTSGARVTTIKDEDAMGSNSATALATQQSIKAYVDNNAGASLANDANNRVVTATGSGGLNGEANMTFTGSALSVTGTGTFSGLMTAGSSSIGSYHIIGNKDFITRDGNAINGTNTTAAASEGATHRFSSAHTLTGSLANGSDVELFRVNVTNTAYRKIQGGKMYVRIQDTVTGGFFQETVTFAYTGNGVIYSSTDRLDSQMAGTQSSYDHEKATILVEFVSDYICVKFSNDTGSSIATTGWDARVTCTLFEMEALSL